MVTSEIDQEVVVVAHPSGTYTGDITIPDMIEATSSKWGHRNWFVTEIADRAFDGCPSLTSVKIESKWVKSIGESAFAECSSLKSVTIPNSVNSIGRAAFYKCPYLKSVTLPNSITTINDMTFAYCENLTINIPKSITKISAQAFMGCKNATFYYAAPLSAVNSSYEIFRGCGNATLIYEGTDDLNKNGAFYCFGTSEIPTYKINPQNVTSIGSGAFNNCENLKALYIQTDNVTNIDPCAFQNCTKLTFMIIECGDYYSYNNRLYKKTVDGNAYELVCAAPSEPTVIIPSEENYKPVTAIGANAFYYYDEIGAVCIPESVKTIGKDAFRNQMMITCLSDNLESVGTIGGVVQRQIYAKSSVIPTLQSAWGTGTYIPIGLGSSNDEDVNNDGKVNATDVMQIYNYILSH